MKTENVNKPMKRNVVLVLLAVILLVGCMSGCAKKDNAVLKQIDAANTTEALVKNNGRVAYRNSFYLTDGSVLSGYAYKDGNRYVVEDDYGVMIDENGDVYGFDTERNKTYRYLFTEGMYEEYAADPMSQPLTLYMYDEAEKVVTSEEKDGVLYIETENEYFLQEFAEDIAYAGYDMEDVESMTLAYEADAKSLELLKIENKLKLKDGKEVVLADVVRVMDCEEYQPDEQLMAEVFSDDARSVTIITDAGTENEKSYTQTIGKDGEIIPSFGEEFEYALYLDPECTEEFEGAEENPKEATYYLKRAE